MLLELNQKVAAITDYSNMFLIVNFFEALKREGIKPVVGCELNLDFYGELSHITVLCENKEGEINGICASTFTYKF